MVPLSGGRPWNRTRRASPRGSYSPLSSQGHQYQTGGQCLHSPRIISSDSLCLEKSLVDLKKLRRPTTLLSPLREEHGAHAVAAVYS